MLRELNALPQGFLDIAATEVHDLLGGPTLIHLRGQKVPPLFLSVLLHGDETTGFLAVQNVLRKYRDGNGALNLPRAVSLFVGNTEAAQAGVRRLDHQPDFNRIWSGDPYGACPEQETVQRVSDIMRRTGVFASVDIHNNTGRNPHYGCVNSLEQNTLALAGLFSDIVVYFLKPSEVQSMAFSQFCTAVTVECGQAGERDGLTHATEYLSTLLELDDLAHIAPSRPKAVYHTTAVVKVPPALDFAFGENTPPADIVFEPGLEAVNFGHLEVGSSFARINGTATALTVTGDHDEDVFNDYFLKEDGQLTLKKEVVLSMFTTNKRAVRQDCLCYFMERYPL